MIHRTVWNTFAPWSLKHLRLWTWNRLVTTGIATSNSRRTKIDWRNSTYKYHQPWRHTILLAHSTESRALFPPECIYCEKIEMKISGKTERPNKFTLKSPWQSLVSEAEKVGKTAFARCVLWKQNTIHRVTGLSKQNTTISTVQKREQWREVLIMNGHLSLQLTVIHCVRFYSTYKKILAKRTTLCNYPRWYWYMLTSSKSLGTQMISIVV